MESTRKRSNLLRTMGIFKDNDSNLIFEQIIKSLAEPVVIEALKQGNNQLKILHPDWFIVNRGGDALNYYYPVNGYIPTNDWDFGLMKVPNSRIDFESYTTMSKWLEDWLTNLASELSKHFRNNVTQRYNRRLSSSSNPHGSDTFYYSKNSFPRLHQIEFGYLKHSGEETKNFIIDVMVYGNGLFQVPEIKGWENKFTYDDLIKLHAAIDAVNTQKFRHVDISPILASNMLESRNRYYNNTFELIVQDTKSEIYYVAPGDLLSDTLIMIWQSITNMNIAQGKNKLTKYLIKYSVLLDAVNKMIDICPKNSCHKITQHILTRNTDYESITVTEEPILKEYYTDSFLQNPMWNSVPASKLIQIGIYLKIYKMMSVVFPILLNKNQPLVKKDNITTSQIYSLTTGYMLLKNTIDISKLTKTQIIGMSNINFDEINIEVFTKTYTFLEEMGIDIFSLTSTQIIKISDINFDYSSANDELFRILGIEVLIPLISRTNTLRAISRENIINIVKRYILYYKKHTPEDYILWKDKLESEEVHNSEELEEIFNKIILGEE